MIDPVSTPKLTEYGKGGECHLNYTERSKNGK